MPISRQLPILVVDDYHLIVRIIRADLARIGYENVDGALNGAEALEKLHAKRYALVISDWHMEPVTGFQLLQRMRADPYYRDVPFIMATVESRPDYVAAARDAGATDYILKPFNTALLRATILGAFEPSTGVPRNFRFDGSFAVPAPRSSARVR
jgi:two-component system chemotaxis response regulator CheY